VVGGQAATEVACPRALSGSGIEVTPVVSGPGSCAYPNQQPFSVQGEPGPRQRQQAYVSVRLHFSPAAMRPTPAHNPAVAPRRSPSAAFACPAPSDLLIACGSAPRCRYAGDVLALEGACTVADGPYAGTAADLVDASQQPVKTIT
jgi:hypothetical protein